MRYAHANFFGGSSSGKSKFIAQRVVYDLISQQRNYLIIRNVGDTNRVSTFNEICKIISEWSLEKFFNINKSSLIITCETQYQAIFKGLDKVDKIKSITPIQGVITDIWVEEVTECEEESIKQLAKRLRGLSKVKKRITLSFNPIFKNHWLFKKYFRNFFDQDSSFKDDKLSILKTTYKDNQFLEQDDIDELENETDEYWHNVYTLGNWGVLGSVIFTNWMVADLSEKKKRFDNFKNGLDWGWNHPVAVTRSHYNAKLKTIYITDEICESELLNADLSVKLKALIGREYVTCDSEDPKSIAELRALGVNTLKARKGQGSVLFGLKWLMQQKIVIDKSCQNIINELQVYQWKKDRDGAAIDEPVKKLDDCIDALRYSYESEMSRHVISRVRTMRRK